MGVENAEEARQRLVRDFDDDGQDTAMTMGQRSKASLLFTALLLS